TGGADSDFSDQVGTFYTGGDSVAVFDHDADGVALYDSLAGSLVDFMAWSSTGSAPSGLAYAQAVTDSLWPSAGYIPVNPGETLNTLRLVPDGYDRDRAEEWDHFGWGESLFGQLVAGANAIQISPQDVSGATPSSVTLVWTDVAAALSYRVTVATDTAFTSVVWIPRSRPTACRS